MNNHKHDIKKYFIESMEKREYNSLVPHHTKSVVSLVFVGSVKNKSIEIKK